MSDDQLMTAEDVAKYLNVPVETVWRWCRNHTLPAQKQGRQWQVSRQELDAFLIKKTNNWS